MRHLSTFCINCWAVVMPDGMLITTAAPTFWTSWPRCVPPVRSGYPGQTMAIMPHANCLVKHLSTAAIFHIMPQNINLSLISCGSIDAQQCPSDRPSNTHYLQSQQVFASNLIRLTLRIRNVTRRPAAGHAQQKMLEP